MLSAIREIRPLWRATQLGCPVAIAPTDMATAKGFLRAVIELVIKAAMIGAVVAAMIRIEAAMVAKSPRQKSSILPIDRHK